ncbi:MAG TPA: GNAT family N-acetyltransferase [Acidimicrobiales bacterium]
MSPNSFAELGPPEQSDENVLGRPGVDGLNNVAWALRDWQFDGTPMQLHPGDLGWNWSFGAEAVAAALWTWSRDGHVLGVGLLDSPRVVRMAIAPEAQYDEVLARQIVADLSRPQRGVLPHGEASIEARFGERLRTLLFENGWEDEEPWTPLRRDLSEPVENCGVRIDVAGPDLATVRVAVHRAAFNNSTFTLQRWNEMTAGSPYVDARCLVAFDDRDAAVAAATVWSAGPGKPGLLEPLGVHRDHRGHGFGTAITLAAAAALREMGSSSATVCTPSSNVGAVRTYKSAGFEQLPDVRDLHRKA